MPEHEQCRTCKVQWTSNSHTCWEGVDYKNACKKCTDNKKTKQQLRCVHAGIGGRIPSPHLKGSGCWLLKLIPWRLLTLTHVLYGFLGAKVTSSLTYYIYTNIQLISHIKLMYMYIIRSWNVEHRSLFLEVGIFCWEMMFIGLSNKKYTYL